MTDLRIFKRDTVNYNVAFADSDGNAVDITGYSVFFTVKSTKTDADTSAIIQKTVTSFPSASAGTAVIALSESDTDVTVGNYFYDMQFIDATGEISTFLDGQFRVNQDITIRTAAP